MTKTGFLLFFSVQPWLKPQPGFSAPLPPWLECLSCPYQWGTRAVLPADTLTRYGLSARHQRISPKRGEGDCLMEGILVHPGLCIPQFPCPAIRRNFLPEQAAGSICPPGLWHTEGQVYSQQGLPVCYPLAEGSLLLAVCSHAHYCRKWGPCIQKDRRAVCKPWGWHKNGLDMNGPRVMNWEFMRDTGETSVLYEGEVKQLPAYLCLSCSDLCA